MAWQNSPCKTNKTTTDYGLKVFGLKSTKFLRRIFTCGLEYFRKCVGDELE